jgi:glutamate-1-semialdehyde 2,1-aminomutase
VKESKNSQKFFAQALELFPGGVNSPVRAFRAVGGEPFIVARGEGAYLYDLDGNRYVDYINSWGPLVLGHAPQEVIKAVSDQLVLGTSYGAPAHAEIELAETIIEYFPSIEKLRFVNSGTEAGMAVIRLARAATGRKKIVKFSGCYHGHADALLVEAGSGVATLAIPSSQGVLRAVTSDTLSLQYNNLEEVEAAFERYEDEIAAVIVEPFVGNAGFIRPKDEFLPFLRKLCDKHSSLLIFDEVMTGFRVALGGAQALLDVKPDITMLGKVIGGGVPVGAFGGRREIMDLLAPLGPVYQAGTLSGNPLAMKAGVSTIKAWSVPGVFEKVIDETRRLITALKESADKVGLSLQVDYQGTMFGFFFNSDRVHNYEDAKRSDGKLFTRFFQKMLERGVYFAPSQFEVGFVSRAHVGKPIDETIEAIEIVIKELSLTG